MTSPKDYHDMLVRARKLSRTAGLSETKLNHALDCLATLLEALEVSATPTSPEPVCPWETPTCPKHGTPLEACPLGPPDFLGQRLSARAICGTSMMRPPPDESPRDIRDPLIDQNDETSGRCDECGCISPSVTVRHLPGYTISYCPDCAMRWAAHP